MPTSSITNNSCNKTEWINDNHYWELIANTGETTFNCRGVGRCSKEKEYCIYDQFLELMNPTEWDAND